jgi:protein-S-isoprenylcysteine O-methyltransferase Ste14
MFVLVMLLVTHVRSCVNCCASRKEEIPPPDYSSECYMAVNELCGGLLCGMCIGFLGLPIVFFLLGPLHLLPVPSIPAGSGAMQFTGALLAVVCLLGFLDVHFEMGANWRPTALALQDHELVRTGVFRFARHPMYAFFVWFTLAVYMATMNWVLVAVWSCMVVMVLLRIPREEQIMEHLFKDKYIEYRRHVSALGVPLCFLFRYPEPTLVAEQPLLGA